MSSQQFPKQLALIVPSGGDPQLLPLGDCIRLSREKIAFADGSQRSSQKRLLTIMLLTKTCRVAQSRKRAEWHYLKH